MTDSYEDIENLLSQNEITKNLAQNEIKVVKKRKLNNGFQATVNIERIKMLKQIASNNVDRNYTKEIILNSVCLTIEDIKRATSQNTHWKVLNFSFRKVLLYGIGVVENHFTRNNESIYTISIDDETGVIIGTYKEYDKDKAMKEKAMLTREENQLKRRREVGVNLFGKFYPSNSQESQYVFNSANNLQKMISENLKDLHKKLQQGPIKEKVLIYAKPHIFHENEVRLYIIDLWESDKVELAWKRHLNRMYINQYLK